MNKRANQFGKAVHKATLYKADMDGFDDVSKDFIGHKSSKHTYLEAINVLLDQLDEQNYPDDLLVPLFDITYLLERINIHITEQEFSNLHSNLSILPHMDLDTSYSALLLEEVADFKDLIINTIQSHRMVFQEMLDQAYDYVGKLEEYSDAQDDDYMKVVYDISSHFSTLEHLLDGIVIREKALLWDLEAIVALRANEEG